MKLNSEEIKEILEMHSKHKKGYVFEQTDTNTPQVSVKDQLQKFINDKCVSVGEVIEIKNSPNENFRYGIKQVSAISDKTRVLFVDGTIWVYEKGKQPVKLPQKWKCATTQTQQTQQPQQQTQQTQPTNQLPVSTKNPRVEATAENCKTAIENLYNNMKSPNTYPLDNQTIVDNIKIARTCAEPANRNIFLARFGLKSKLKDIAQRYSINL